MREGGGGKPSGLVVPSHLARFFFFFTAAHAERRAKWRGEARVSSLQSRAQGFEGFRPRRLAFVHGLAQGLGVGAGGQLT